MKRLFKITGIVIGFIIVVFVLLIYVYFREAIHVEKHTSDELASLLTPHFRINKPPGEGPFPAIISFHGGGGILLPNGDIDLCYVNWADYFVSLGYACILVDSYTGRGFTDDDVSKVYSGKKFWGPERSGDVLIAIDEVRKLPYVNPNQLVIMGHSSGGWAVMSLLAMDLNEKLPPNLSASPAKSMDGVKGAIVLYPFFPPFMLDSGGDNWNNTIKTLVLMGGKDKFTKSTLKTLFILNKKNKPIIYHVYPSAYHAYDIAPEDHKKILKLIENATPPDLEATKDSRERVKVFLSEVFSQT